MTIDHKIRDEKLQYDINREAAKISALSSGKIDKYDFLTGEAILPSDQSRIIEQAKFTYSRLGKTFEKQIKTIEDQGIKQVEALKALQTEEKDSESSQGNQFSPLKTMFRRLSLSSFILYVQFFYYLQFILLKFIHITLYTCRQKHLKQHQETIKYN